MISTQNVQEPKSLFPQRLDPGIHEVKIVSVTSGLSQLKKTPFIEVNFENAAGLHKETFYMSSLAMPISLERIKHLMTKVMPEAVLDGLKANTVDEYAALLNTNAAGTSLRIKLSGKETFNTKTQKTYLEREFKYYPYAEALTQSPSVLKFSEALDIKRLQPMGTPVHDPMDEMGAFSDLPLDLQ